MTEAAKKWEPTREPFRLVVTVQSSTRGNFGWSTRPVRTFPSLAEAIAEAEKPQGRGVLKVRVDEAINPETWPKNGSWKRRYAR